MTKKVCPTNWYNAYDRNPYCVRFVQMRKLFKDTKPFCEQWGGHLLEFATLKEAFDVEKFMRGLNVSYWEGWYYFGLTRGKTVFNDQSKVKLQ